MTKLLLIFLLSLVFITGFACGQKLLECQVKNEETCKIYSAEVWENDTVSIEIKGENITSEDIKKVLFSDSTLFRVPKELFSTFENLEVLDMYGCELKTIELATFENAENLKILKLYSNDFQEVEPEMFLGLENLKELYFSFNRIKKLHKIQFQHLRVLEILDIGGNLIDHLHEDTFNSLTKLKKIILDFNYLEFLPQNLFSKNTNLEYVSMFGNSLDAISNRIFPPKRYPRLQYLGFQVNNCISKVYHHFQNEYAQVRKDLLDCMTGYLQHEDQQKDDRIQELEERIEELSENLTVTNERLQDVESILESLTNKTLND